MHARSKVRAEVVNLLSSKFDCVYSSRVYPLDTLPAVSVYTNTDSVLPELSTDYADMHEVVFTVEYTAKTIYDLDQELDNGALKIEQVLTEDLGGVVLNFYLESTEIDSDDAQESQTGVARLVYRCQYQTIRTQPQNIA